MRRNAGRYVGSPSLEDYISLRIVALDQAHCNFYYVVVLLVTYEVYEYAGVQLLVVPNPNGSSLKLVVGTQSNRLYLCCF
jgi:hypothetical protein